MHRRGHRIWASAFVAFACIGVAGALLTPPTTGPDEVAHIVKAAAVVRGDVQTDVEWAKSFGLRVPHTAVTVPEGYSTQTLFGHRSCWHEDTRDGWCDRDLPDRTGPRVVSSSYVGTYPPTYYAVVGLPTLVLPPGPGLRAARALSALITAAFFASAVWASARLGGAVMLTGVLLTATPAALYFAGVVNPSGPEIAAAVSLWTSVLILARAPDGPVALVVQSAVSAGAVALSRPLGPILLLAIVAAIGLVAFHRTLGRRWWARRSIRWATAGVAVAWLTSVAYVLASHAATSVMTRASPDRSSALSRAVDAIGRTGSVERDQVGIIDARGPSALRLPSGLIWAWLIAIALLVVVALVVGTRRDRLALVAITVGGLSVAVLAAVAKPDVAWQPRYSLPLTVGIPVVAGWIGERSERVPRPVRRWSLVAVALLWAAAMLVGHRRWTHRVLYHYPDEVSGRIGTPLWDAVPSLTPARLLALVGATAMVTLVVVLARGATDSAPEPGSAQARAGNGQVKLTS